MKMYHLIQQEKTTVEEVLKKLDLETPGTPWARKTNILAANYVRHLDDVYKGNWAKGFLPKELFFEILLPKHEHSLEAKVSIFPLDTPLSEVLDFYKDSDSKHAKDCMDAILYLKEKIKKEGFTTTIILSVINDTLKHVDGLHRILALMIAMQEGYEYKPVPVYLCNASI